MASITDYLLEPERLEVAAGLHGVGFGLSLLGVLAGGFGLFLLVRRLGVADSGLSRSEAVLGFPLALAAFILPSVIVIALGQPLPSGDPLTSGIVQAGIALGAIFVLANHPWRPGDEPPGEWQRPRQLRWVPLLWLAAFPLMQLAVFCSAQLHHLFELPIVTQEVVARLRSRHDAGWIFAWYLMAVVAAPLMEEFVFRVVLFGGMRRLLSPMSEAAGWRHPGAIVALFVSVSAFVMAHGVWGWTIGILPLTLLSLILTALYAHTRSIWPGVLYHALHNAFVVTMQFFVL
ncbi:MAG: CPBP family intramembrane metalloprotease [Planctomycetes bacterium]|nr:CPBP family intramembrane metalloprotease [Planctomycetota bacterium]MCB9934170.1 CPBP family intramembrane metalloprotease [Planctomycetota bacterium]